MAGAFLLARLNAKGQGTKGEWPMTKEFPMTNDCKRFSNREYKYKYNRESWADIPAAATRSLVI